MAEEPPKPNEPQPNPEPKPTPDPEPPTPPQPPEPEKKIEMTQAQIDAMLARERDKATRLATKDLPSKEELEELIKLRDAQKTEAEKTAEKAQKLEKELNEATALKRGLEEQNYLLTDLKIADEETRDYVAFQVKKGLTDTDTIEDFKEKAKTYWEANQKKFAKGGLGSGQGHQNPPSPDDNLSRKEILRRELFKK